MVFWIEQLMEVNIGLSYKKKTKDRGRNAWMNSNYMESVDKLLIKGEVESERIYR